MSGAVKASRYRWPRAAPTWTEVPLIDALEALRSPATAPALQPRTSLGYGLLGPVAPPVPSGGWVLHLPGGRSRFIATDRELSELVGADASWQGAKRIQALPAGKRS